ncbi:TetR/AcrR family transcriptional regulator [Sporomusa aerivorans]|uniref:TetR/AcrR family transcriptional regulator n=1 Tax=Sporomusa aerivorans TaxID=204936 RepID=UPI003529F6B8
MSKNNKEITKLYIQQAALELFSKKGYANVSMDEIAARAKFTKRTVYKYFPSKAALFASVFEGYLKQLNDDFARIIRDTDDTASLIKGVARHLFEFSHANEKFVRLFWMINNEEVLGEIPPELMQHIRLWNQNIADQFIGAMEERKLTGVFARYSPELMNHMVSAVNKGILIHVNKEEKLKIWETEKEKKIKLLELFLVLLDLGLGSEETSSR